jgi:tetratricopeptide (TPR) repeat protein
VDKIHFIFWEAMKVLSLAFIGLLAAKAVASLAPPADARRRRRFGRVKTLLYAAILALAVWGAWNVGYNVAAEAYLWASQDNIAHAQYGKAYVNALRAVQLRPGVLRYWRSLVVSKVYARQFDSALADLPTLQAVSGGRLDEEDSYRFAACHFFLGHFDQAIALTQQLIRQNREYAAPYVVQGMAFTAQKKYREAEGTYLAVLQIFPNHAAAVEGLAHVYFLEGKRAQAVAVLNETAKYQFPSEARKRFEALKGLYAQ